MLQCSQATGVPAVSHLFILQMSDFREWQKTRKEISLQQLEEFFPGTCEQFAFGEAPPEKIFWYRGDVWITQQNDGAGSYFWLYIERDDYTSEDLEILEMRMYLWAYDENCQRSPF